MNTLTDELCMLTPEDHASQDLVALNAKRAAIIRLCKAARAILGWSQYTLAQEAGVTMLTISNFERCVGFTRQHTFHRIWDAFERAGVVFFDAYEDGGVGLRLRQ